MTKRLITAGLMLVALIGLTAIAPEAEAGLLPTKVTITPDVSGSFRFTYAVVLTSDSTLRNGDFFTIFDFHGFIPGTDMVYSPYDWQFSYALTGAVPPNTVPTDLASVYNLTWTYVGTGDPLPGQVGLGNFSAYSTSGLTTTNNFAALTHRAFDGQADSNITFTTTPRPMDVPPPPVPEPTTLTLLGLAVPFFGLSRLRRKSVV